MKQGLLLALCIGAMMECKTDSVRSLSDEEINGILATVDESSDRYIQKGIEFDSIVVYAGYRVLGAQKELLKMRLFYFGDHVRGYYKLPNGSNKNVQVFGRLNATNLVLKCVTTDQTDDQGSFMIIENNQKGIWASPHHNFERRIVDLSRYDADYESLTNW